jgi:hypothetical protein
MESRDHHDHNFKTSPSPRADSFVDTTDDAMTVSTDPTEVDARDDGDEEADDAIIKCICGYGAGYDDDDCTSCMMCETWQHNLCYFVVLGRPIPKGEDDLFFCIDCAANLDVDPELARDAMRRKLRKLALISDRMDELKCEIAQREEEMEGLQYQLACVESEWYTNGAALAAQGSLPDSSEVAREIWEGWAKEHFLIEQDMVRTVEERDAIRVRIGELEADAERTRLNEPTQREANAKVEAVYFEKSRGTPAFWTTASSLGTRSCYYWSKPPCLLRKPDPVLAAKDESIDKVVKPKKKKRRTVR